MRLSPLGINLGGDPELFFTEDGKVIGSEMVIGEKEDVFADPLSPGSTYRTPYGKVIQDGVQAEINLMPSTCRAALGNSLHWAMVNLAEKLKPNQGINFSGVIEMTDEELNKLSAKARVLGCAPSHNAHDRNASIGVNPATYLKRSAGGHIHFGYHAEGIENAVPILDALLGNTCVLLDRDPGAAERRKVYGRAGEYRLPPHGLEYRTLSNFWLRSYPLMGFVFAMGRMALSIHISELRKSFLELVDLKSVVRAINTNDHDLALANFTRLRPFIEEYFQDDNGGSLMHNEAGIFSTALPLSARKLKDFDFFLTRPVEEWFPHDPLTYWTQIYKVHPDKEAAKISGWDKAQERPGYEFSKRMDYPEYQHYLRLSDPGHYMGWETFLTKTVRPLREEAELIAANVIAQAQQGQEAHLSA